MSKPVIRTPTGERLVRWFGEQIDALERASEECSTDARQYLRGQIRTLERTRDHVLTEVAYCEVEAVAMTTAGATMAEAQQWLEDAIGGETGPSAA